MHQIPSFDSEQKTENYSEHIMDKQRKQDKECILQMK